MTFEFECFCLSSVLLVIGIFGILINKKSIITILVSTEVILLSANINFVSMSAVHGIAGHIFAFVVLTIAAAELAVGLAILIVHFRTTKDISIKNLNRLKG